MLGVAKRLLVIDHNIKYQQSKLKGTLWKEEEKSFFSKRKRKTDQERRTDSGKYQRIEGDEGI